MAFGFTACSRGSVDFKTFPDPKEDLKISADAGPQTMVLAGGCFWCTEGVFEQFPGVSKVVAGYAGGTKATADYETVSTGSTGHAESIQITYDPKITSYGKLLKVFFSIVHDPTELDHLAPLTKATNIARRFFVPTTIRSTSPRHISSNSPTPKFSMPRS